MCTCLCGDRGFYRGTNPTDLKFDPIPADDSKASAFPKYPQQQQYLNLQQSQSFPKRMMRSHLRWIKAQKSGRSLSLHEESLRCVSWFNSRFIFRIILFKQQFPFTKNLGIEKL